MLQICRVRCGAQLRRNFSAQALPEAVRKMGAWQLHAYGDEVLYSDKVRIPPVTGANGVLVKVSAASLNPIDVEMASKSTGFAYRFFFFNLD